MKTIGLIGGMSWESTITYYKVINEVIKYELGGLHSAKILLCSVDFAEIEKYQVTGQWDKSAEILIQANQSLVRAGADFSLICTNTMHKVYPQVAASSQIPLIHIGAATASELKKKKVEQVLLLGTKYTMEQDFYKDKISAAGIQVMVPNDQEREFVNQVIFDELCLGKIKESSKNGYLNLINKYADLGAEGVILGCTEIGLLLNQKDTLVPLFDTAEIHAKKAAYDALKME